MPRKNVWRLITFVFAIPGVLLGSTALIQASERNNWALSMARSITLSGNNGFCPALILTDQADRSISRETLDDALRGEDSHLQTLAGVYSQIGRAHV